MFWILLSLFLSLGGLHPMDVQGGAPIRASGMATNPVGGHQTQPHVLDVQGGGPVG
ncbi:MAG: hypothetical protein ACREMP_06105 [Candidatus Tyrphobacter sp.]